MILVCVNHPVAFGAQAVVYSSSLVCEFECCLAHGLRLGALLRGAAAPGGRKLGAEQPRGDPG